MDIKDLLSQFTLFNPRIGKRADLPAEEGNYIVVLRQGSELPGGLESAECSTVSFDGKEYRIVYTGVASDLKRRVWTNHLHGNGGTSTLRKTLGSLFGYKKIPRDKNNPNNGKTKFEPENEEKLTSWMEENLLFAILANNRRNELEMYLIDSFQPPLNVNGSRASTVDMIHALRTQK